MAAAHTRRSGKHAHGSAAAGDWRLSGPGAALCGLALVAAAACVAWMYALRASAALQRFAVADVNSIPLRFPTSPSEVAMNALLLLYSAGVGLAHSALNPYGGAAQKTHYSGLSCSIASLLVLAAACVLSGAAPPARPWRVLLAMLLFWASVLPAVVCVFKGGLAAPQALPLAPSAALALLCGAALLFPPHSAVRRMFAYYYLVPPGVSKRVDAAAAATP